MLLLFTNKNTISLFSPYWMLIIIIMFIKSHQSV